MDNSLRPVAVTATAARLGGQGDGGDKAEYADPSRSGLESGFYVTDRGLPWHIRQSRALNVPELMIGVDGLVRADQARILAGHDWTVEQKPLAVSMGRDKWRKAAYATVPGWVANVRSDTEAVLGVVTPSFKVVQPDVIYSFADAIVDDSGAHYETAGSLFGGRWIFVSMEIPDEIKVEGDPSEYRLFMLVSTGFDGRHATEACVTIERVMCKNTANAAIKGAISRFSIRHTSGTEGRIQAAREALGISFKYAEAFSEVASDLVAKPLAERQVEAIIRDLFPVPARDADKEDRFPETTAGKILNLYRTSPSVEPIKGTAYGVFNAVTEYLDHEVEYRGRTTTADEVRADSLIWGGPSQIKVQKALDTLVKV